MPTFLSREREPLRRYAYGVLGSGLAVLATFGVLSGEEVAVVTALAGSVLLVPTVEVARSNVTPVPEGSDVGL